jgi:hypothetical protein
VLAYNHAGAGIGKVSEAAYAAAGAKDQLTRTGEALPAGKVVEWLLK